MTAYERFQALELDRSWLGLERGDTRGDYFCTPLGAQVIGWAGVDGIHFCFVEGFGEMVFAVSPANLPGDYVQPLAGSFADFIRLVLACGGIDAAEQAHGWSRVQFDEYLAQYPPDGERRAALDALGAGWGWLLWTTPTGISREYSPPLTTARYASGRTTGTLWADRLRRLRPRHGG